MQHVHIHNSSSDSRNADTVTIKLLSKFHLNPLIVNSITQTDCMCACIHVLSACVCVWACTCKPLNPGTLKQRDYINRVLSLNTAD